MNKTFLVICSALITIGTIVTSIAMAKYKNKQEQALKEAVNAARCPYKIGDYE